MNIRDTKYIDSYLRRLKKIWKNFPELRFGQLIGNCVNYQQLYYFSDEEILRMIEHLYSSAKIDNKGDTK